MSARKCPAVHTNASVREPRLKTPGPLRQSEGVHILDWRFGPARPAERSSGAAIATAAPLAPEPRR